MVPKRCGVESRVLRPTQIFCTPRRIPPSVTSPWSVFSTKKWNFHGKKVESMWKVEARGDDKSCPPLARAAPWVPRHPHGEQASSKSACLLGLEWSGGEQEKCLLSWIGVAGSRASSKGWARFYHPLLEPRLHGPAAPLSPRTHGASRRAGKVFAFLDCGVEWSGGPRHAAFFCHCGKCFPFTFHLLSTRTTSGQKA